MEITKNIIEKVLNLDFNKKEELIKESIILKEYYDKKRKRLIGTSSNSTVILSSLTYTYSKIFHRTLSDEENIFLFLYIVFNDDKKLLADLKNNNNDFNKIAVNNDVSIALLKTRYNLYVKREKVIKSLKK